MVPLTSLLIPIALAAVLVFIASSIIHMATPLHKHDLKRLPNEDAVLNALRPLNLAPGDYAMPMAGSMEAMRSPEHLAKVNAGPVVFMTVLPNREMNMTNNLIQWFIYCLFVSFFTAYVTSRALGIGVGYLDVFQISGATSFMAYWMSLPQNSIWWKRNWAWTLRSAVDGLIYAGMTGGAFGWLWPR